MQIHAPATPATLVLIASAGHSGSTLLDLLLGNHSAVSSAGEMNRLTLHAADRVCACGATVTHCPYWNRVRAFITAQRSTPSLIDWEACHTDLPAANPLMRLDGVGAHVLVDDAPVPALVRGRMADAGIILSDRAMLSRRGGRDFKWRVDDPDTKRTYVLRSTERTLCVYEAAPSGKNPLRLIPRPLEVALALGSARLLGLLRSYSAPVARYCETAENSWSVADAMAAIGGCRFVIDSSKSPVRLKLLYMLRPDRVRIVHLVRDGRAVTASAMRRRHLSASTAARIWRRDNRNLDVMLRTVPGRARIDVHYEALCEDPGRELKKICGFLDIEFERSMLTLWERPVHNIPGNPMLFDRSVRTIRRDERWRRELSAGDVRAFERAAGRLNRSFGYA